MFQSPRGGGRRKRALLTIAVAALGAAGLMGQSALASPVRPPAVPAFEQYFADHNAAAKAYLGGHAGGDRITATTYSERLNTQGGVAPDISECNADTVGHDFPVHYTADYYFYRAA